MGFSANAFEASAEKVGDDVAIQFVRCAPFGDRNAVTGEPGASLLGRRGVRRSWHSGLRAVCCLVVFGHARLHVVDYGNDNVTCQRIFGELFVTIGDRLKEERNRLGMSQPDFAALAGTTKKSQITYEKGVMPDAAYLAAIAKAGADIQYIVTERRQGHGIGESAVHQAVLDAADLLSLDKKIDAQQLAKVVVKLCTKSVQPADFPAPAMNQQNVIGGDAQQFNAPVYGGVAGRDIVRDKATNKK